MLSTKFFIFLIFILILSPTGKASSEQCTSKTGTLAQIPLEKNFFKSLKDYARDASGCETLSDSEESKKKFQQVVKEEQSRGEKIVLSSSTPHYRTSNTVSYRFNGQRLKPGESLYVWVPSDIAKRGLNFVILGHRQDPSADKGKTPGSKKDQEPGLTSVQVYDANRSPSERWRYWAGSASGKNGSKFAEVNSSYEVEGLYQWSKLGHVTVDTDNSPRHDELKPTLVRLVSLGSDPVDISELTIKANPVEADDYVEKVFTEGTQFGNIKSGQGYVNGGGQNQMGTFPKALVLNGHSGDKANLPPGWKYQQGELWIPLPKGKILTGVEVNGGDSHPDKVQNDDGGWGTKGWSKLNIGIRKDGKTIDHMMKRENVPPEGFLTTSPSKCDQVIGDNEYLVVNAESDTMYLAGIRLGFKNP